MAFGSYVIHRFLTRKGTQSDLHIKKNTAVWKMDWKGASWNKRSQETNYEAVSIVR